MANGEKKYSTQQLDTLIGKLIESTLELSDDEVVAEMREEGLDPDEVAEHSRSVLLAAFKKYEQRNLRLVRQQLEQKTKSPGRTVRSLTIPERYEDRVLWLQKFVKEHPQVTLQHREFEQMSPEDLASCLEQLEELWLLEDSSGSMDKGE